RNCSPKPANIPTRNADDADDATIAIEGPDDNAPLTRACAPLTRSANIDLTAPASRRPKNRNNMLPPYTTGRTSCSGVGSDPISPHTITSQLADSMNDYVA